MLYDLIVVKANTSFRVGYAKIAGEIYAADTPGVAAPNLLLLPFRKSSKRLYPWVDDPQFRARSCVKWVGAASSAA